MVQYRCYVLNKQDRIFSATTIDADTDADALIKAAGQIRVSEFYPAIEVWEGSRIVGRVPQGDHLD